MEDDAPVIYGLEYQARALAAHVADTDTIRFFVGTQSLKLGVPNQIHQIDFDDENNQLDKKVFIHEVGEIWQVTSCPSDPNVIGTVYSKIVGGTRSEMVCGLWRLSECGRAAHNSTDGVEEDAVSGDSASSTTAAGGAVLEPLCQVEGTRQTWEPTAGKKFITLQDANIYLYDIQGTLVDKTSLEAKGQPRLTAASWNPHHNSTQFATANETNVKLWDIRTMSVCGAIDGAHSGMVRELDFNPNKQYVLATCGDDCKARFWDIRSTGQPLRVTADHSHWVWTVRFNTFHDQLVLTSSSDSRVILSSLASISSEPSGRLVDPADAAGGQAHAEDSGDEGVAPSKEGVIATYEEHEDSVYSVEWSAADPWVFASLSYDGRLVINRVPRAEKYRILL